MAYRIVLEKYSTGKCVYRVDTNNGLFGLRKRFGWWRTCSIDVPVEGIDVTFRAAFNTLKEAEEYVEKISEDVVSCETLATYQ